MYQHIRLMIVHGHFQAYVLVLMELVLFLPWMMMETSSGPLPQGFESVIWNEIIVS